MNYYQGNKIENCSSGLHRMTAENVYWHRRKHGLIYKVCRACKRDAYKERNKDRVTKQDRRRIAEGDVIKQDVSDITNCPKCQSARLIYGRGDSLEDELRCGECGWRPTATVEVKL